MLLTGGCLCGAIRYEYKGEPVRAFICHCVDCRRSGGSLFHYGIMLDKSCFKFTGTPACFEIQSDSGRIIQRFFCQQCGSGLWNELEIAPKGIVLKGGTLDELPGSLKPTAEVYTRSKAASCSLKQIELHYPQSSAGVIFNFDQPGVLIDQF